MAFRPTRRAVGALAFLVAMLAAAPATRAQAVLIDFDIDPSGIDIAAGTVLDTLYASMGLTFSLAQGTGHVYANANLPTGFGSAPNAVSPYPPPYASDFSEEGYGPIRVYLSSPASGGCIDVRPDGGGDLGVLRAFDAGGAMIGEETSVPGVTQTLCVSGFRIRRLEFAGAGSTYARFDNLSLTYGAGPMEGPYYLPNAANVPGLLGTRWRTDFEACNLGSYASNVTVELLERGKANPSPAAAQLMLDPGRCMRYGNVLDALFSYGGAATLRVTGLGGDLLVNARTYNDDPAGTYGQFMPPLTLDDMVQPGATGRLIQLSQSATTTTGYRTNIGLVNASPFAITVDVDLYTSTGVLLGSKRYTLGAYESTQVDRIFTLVTGAAVSDGYATVVSPTPGAVFYAFASSADNRSGDAIYIGAM